MAVFVSNIVIEQGFDFNTTFELEDTTTNGPINLTGYEVDSQIRKTYSSSSSVSFASTVIDPDNGKIQISLGSTSTSSLKSGRYVYDVKLTDGAGGILKAVEGSALVRSGVTR
jgi:uncharacterized protein (DUF2147 family)